MGKYLINIENNICERITMNRRMRNLCIEWCDNNLKRVVDEWFYGREYTLEEVLDEREYIVAYAASSFLKWYVENGS